MDKEALSALRARIIDQHAFNVHDAVDLIDSLTRETAEATAPQDAKGDEGAPAEPAE